MINQTNPIQGSNVEHLLANSLPIHERAFSGIIASIFGKNLSVNDNAKVIGTNNRKTDVNWSLNKDKSLRVSIKSFKNAGYNHVERRHLKVFCERNQISATDFDFLSQI